MAERKRRNEAAVMIQKVWKGSTLAALIPTGHRTHKRFRNLFKFDEEEDDEFEYEGVDDSWLLPPEDFTLDISFPTSFTIHSKRIAAAEIADVEFTDLESDNQQAEVIAPTNATRPLSRVPPLPTLTRQEQIIHEPTKEEPRGKNTQPNAVEELRRVLKVDLENLKGVSPPTN